VYDVLIESANGKGIAKPLGEIIYNKYNFFPEVTDFFLLILGKKLNPERSCTI